MIRDIVKDEAFLSQKAEDATLDDVSVAEDLVDTLKAHSHECVGLAANMIGVNKRIIAFYNGQYIWTMFNPEIIKTNKEYEAVEGCLSLEGKRKAKRFKTIKVRFLMNDFSSHTMVFKGITAQIIQHEIDHTTGILL